MPATDTDFERDFAELVAQLRDMPAATPESLRARVRALGEPEAPPTLRDRVATFRWRRAVLVASLQQTTTAGRPGEADLVLRVPVARVDEAMTNLAALGTVIEQHLSIVDLQQTLDQQRRRIRSLRFQVARLTEALRNPSLPEDVRLRLRFQLEEARQSLTHATRAHNGTLREAALSEISLALTTEHAAGALSKHHEGRLERAARN